MRKLYLVYLSIILMTLVARIASAQNPKAQGGGPFKE
jgi:hypothetical protein